MTNKESLIRDIKRIEAARHDMAAAKANLNRVLKDICEARAHRDENGEVYESVELLSILRDELCDLVLKEGQ